jgi:hypothetical protein
MKKKILHHILIAIVLTFVSVNIYSQTNEIKKLKSSELTHQDQKRDSLPEGVTEDWLNSLHDENGNRILPEDPETDAFQRKIFNGLNNDDRFGNSVKTAGDVNGDGYDDIIVGAYGYSSNMGRAYIFFGGIIMNTVPDVIMSGEYSNDFFGASVSSAGDANGDGYADVIVGAYGYFTNIGRAYIYFGGAAMNNTADVTMTGDPNNYLGKSVSSAGDVNGDGYADLIVGAYGYSSSIGRAHIYFGGTAMDNIADITLTGETTSYFGASVSSAGDVNGDGYADVIVGAYVYSSSTGRVYIYFGGAAMDTIADVTMTGESTGDYFGVSVSSAGDVNGDGFSDVIVGAERYSSITGRAYIYFGGGAMNNIADVTMTGETTNNFFGISVSTAGDLNGDGYSDVIAGAYGYSSFTGRAYIYFGGTTMNNAADVTMTGEATNNFYGVSVSTAGDVNGDGYSDVIAGAFGYSLNVGRVYLYDYFMKNEITHDMSIIGEATGNLLGHSVSSAGDVNGDGYSDVIVGADGYSSNTGKAYIFFGGIVMDNFADVTMTGLFTNYYFGRSVSSAGDVNGDGYSDVIVGAYGYSLNTGRAYIYFGGAAMDNVADVTMTGGAIGNYFGSSVSSAGDVNSDGYADVIVCADQYSAGTGRAYIFFGGAAMDNTADVTMTGEATNNYFGFPVSSAGDVNGDGYADVIIGAYGYSSNTGRVYIYFGGSAMDNVADVAMTGEATDNSFGRSVSSAGDVNSDGYADVIVGASGYSSFYSYMGRAYIYFGGAVVDNIADVTMTGETTNNNFGLSVSSAGDVNVDGYADVIVGAQGYSTSTGRAYLFFGGTAMNNITDVTMTGETVFSSFGSSVSSAGDVNGDGLADLVVGAYGYSSSTGKAYIYNSSAISVKPILNYVRDVPNDQGGKVTLKWAKSSFEAYGFGNITNYLVYRSIPPGFTGFQWVQIADIAAVNFPIYYYDANTLFDSSSVSTGNTYFLIKARNGNTGQIWNSNIMYGRSLDNLAPPVLSPFTAAAVSNNVSLNWKRSNAPDLLNYILYRSTSPTINPDIEPVFATTTDSTYLDTSPLTGTYYYFIVGQDVHNNKSPVAVADAPGMKINLTAFIEGFYNSTSNTMSSDTITVELRNSNSPYAVADVSKSGLAANGLVTLNFATAAPGNYYIVFKHRNSIETWSANPVSMTNGTPVNYNFSNSSTQAYGNNMKQVDSSPIRFSIFSGDVNQDGIVDAGDLSQAENDATNSLSGYVPADVTGDDFVDAGDVSIVENNVALGVSAILP